MIATQAQQLQPQQHQTMRNPSLRLSSFTLGEKCGEGCGGVVWRATRKADAQLCAVKILKYVFILI